MTGRDFPLATFVRLDQGGLAAQSQQMTDLLRPEKVVCVDMGTKGRGPAQDPADLEWHGADVLHVGASAGGSMRDVVDFLRGIGALWSAESLYWMGLPRKLQTRGVAMRVHTNPELAFHLDPEVSHALPTVWEQERMGLPVVPHPTPVGDPVFDELAKANAAKTGPVERVLHVAAPAMLDRNGTQVVLDACRAYAGPPFTLVVAGSGLTGRHAFDLPESIGRVTIERLPEQTDRHAMYADVDLLVLPRRYGGLCLVAYEAAAAGLPVVMPDLSPQDSWSGVRTFPTLPAHHVESMRGGRFQVHEPDPEALAVHLAAYTAHPTLVMDLRAQARQWAEGLSWPNVRQAWHDWLDPACRAVMPTRPPREQRDRAPRRVQTNPRRRPRVGPPYR